MRSFACGLGVVLLLLAAASALAEIIMLVQGVHSVVSLGWIWFQIHANSLVGFQALIEKNVGPAVWPPIQYLLTVPASLVAGIPALFLCIGCLRSRRPGAPSTR